MIDTTQPIAHFLGFTALLRRAGFAVAPEQTIAWLAAIELLGPNEIDDIRRAARATIGPPPERFAEFDALFDAHFLGSIVPGLEGEPSDEEPLHAAEDSAVGPEPLFGDETRESGAKATSAERLSARRFGPGGDGETLRQFARALPARVPRRRGYRWRSARSGSSTDARRMFRDAMRHAGEFVRLRQRRRRLRQRRIVVLIDVSGSMKERTQAHLAFAHALVRAAELGRSLYHRHAAHAHYPAAALAQPRSGAHDRFAAGRRLGRRHADRRCTECFSCHPPLRRAGARRGFDRAFGRARARRSDGDGRCGRTISRA